MQDYMQNYFVNDCFYFVNVSVGKYHKYQHSNMDFYDLHLIFSGSMTQIVNGETIVLKKNDAMFLKPGTDRIRPKKTEQVKYAAFNFHFIPGRELDFDVHLKNCVSSNVRNIINAVGQKCHSDYFHSHEKLVNILNYVLFDIYDTINFKSNNIHINKILRLVDEKITEKLSLADVSHEINLSKEYTSYIFKKEMNQTLTEYITKQKMNVAKNMILSNGMSLTEIASYLGYDDYKYFSRLFKKYHGTTPIKMR